MEEKQKNENLENTLDHVRFDLHDEIKEKEALISKL